MFDKTVYRFNINYAMGIVPVVAATMYLSDIFLLWRNAQLETNVIYDLMGL